MRRWNKLPAALVGMVIMVFLGAGAYAYWKQIGSTMNILTTGAFQNRIVEKYTIPKEVNPGDQIDKVVHVSNTGNVDSLIRVEVTKVFGELSANGEFKPDYSLDPEVIEIDFDDNWWMKGKDQYFYYKEVLKPGKTTREPLFKSYRLSRETGNAYQGKEARIIVTLESIQAEIDPATVWGIRRKDLGITYEKGKDGPPTNVIYHGKNGGFAISESTTDLFASFKLLLPGCKRTQNIVLDNRSEEKVELFLRAEETQQMAVSQEQRERIDSLLFKDAKIQIKEGDTLLYSGPIAGTGTTAGASIRQDISLGIFQANEKKNLTVSLEMDPDMKTEMGNLSARVRWIFTAKGEDGVPITTQSVPKTGDSTHLTQLLFLLAESLFGVVGIILFRRKLDERR